MEIKGFLGCEIEGLIKVTDFKKLQNITKKREDWVLGGDGSINYENGFNTFELKVGIYNIKDKEKMIKDLKKVLELIKVNTSCGLHIHISFNSLLDYYKLLNWDFVNNFQYSFKNKFKNKIEQDRTINHFCEFYFNKEEFEQRIEKQLKSYFKDSSRYKAINFNSFNLYKTIEFRIFPATNNLNKFTEYLEFLLNQIEEGLNVEKDFKDLEVEVKPVNKKAFPITFKEIIEVEVKN